MIIPGNLQVEILSIWRFLVNENITIDRKYTNVSLKYT